MSQFGYLNTMQDELEAANTAYDIQILGINAIGAEAGQASMVKDKDLPLLQDVSSVNVSVLWGAGYRDLVILDEDNVVVGKYNLNTYDLSKPENYAVVENAILDAATP